MKAKKLIVTVLSFVLICTLSVPAFAAKTPKDFNAYTTDLLYCALMKRKGACCRIFHSAAGSFGGGL